MINTIYLKELIYKFFAEFININLFYLNKKFKNKLIYSKYISFGDTFTFCIENYFKIKNKNLKIVTFNHLEKKTIEFFFLKKKIVKIFFLIPNIIPFYRINYLLFSKKNFTPSNIFEPNQSKLKVKNKHKDILNKIININLDYVSPKLKIFKQEKYYLLSIKHYGEEIKIGGSDSRATANLKKVYELIEFLSKNKIVILCNKRDRIYKIIKSYYERNDNIFFFDDLSENWSILDQLFIHKFSFLSLGNPSGSLIMSIYLKKKIIFFDCVKTQINRYSLMHSDNIINLFKKIKINNKLVDMTDTIVNKILYKHGLTHEKTIISKKYIIKENTFFEIKKAVKKFDNNNL